MIRRPPRSTRKESSAASDVYKRQDIGFNTKLRAHSLKEKPGNLVQAKEIMKTKVRVLNLENSLSDAQVLFKKYGFHHLPIIENTKLIGLITSNDLRNLEDLGTKSIKNYYSELIFAVSSNTPLKILIKVFIHEEIHCLPVISEKGDLEGIITQKDILKWMLKYKKYKV